MDIKAFDALPQDAKDIRTEVFVEEQGFKYEFDENDDKAIHTVGYINGDAVATARILQLNDNEYMIGRIAVRRTFRRLGLGAKIISNAETIVFARGGTRIYIHAQTQAVPFYEKQGYLNTGEHDYEEFCEHWMMKKEL